MEEFGDGIEEIFIGEIFIEDKRFIIKEYE
jgi:hypothetical protein